MAHVKICDDDDDDNDVVPSNTISTIVLNCVYKYQSVWFFSSRLIIKAESYCIFKIKYKTNKSLLLSSHLLVNVSSI